MVVSSIVVLVVLVVVPTVYSSEIAAGTVEPGLIVAGPAGTVTTPMVAVDPSVVSVIVHVEPASRPSYVFDRCAGRPGRDDEGVEADAVAADVDADLTLLTRGRAADRLGDGQRAGEGQRRLGLDIGADHARLGEDQLLRGEQPWGVVVVEVHVSRGHGRLRPTPRG